MKNLIKKLVPNFIFSLYHWKMAYLGAGKFFVNALDRYFDGAIINIVNLTALSVFAGTAVFY